MKRERIFLFDLLRVFAILTLCLTHTCTLIENFCPAPMFLGQLDWAYSAMMMGLYSLNIFIFVSGFLAFESVKSAESFQDVVNLFKARFRKLYLPFFMFLLILWVFFRELASPVWAHLTFTSNLIPVSELRAAWLWYVALDFQLHLIFYPLFFFLRKLPREKLLGIFGGLILLGLGLRIFIAHSLGVKAIYWSMSGRDFILPYYQHVHFPPWTRFIPFLAGALVSLFFTSKASAGQKKVLTLLGMGLIILVYLGTDHLEGTSSAVLIGLKDFTVALIIVCVIFSFKDLSWRAPRWMRFLSDLSLGIYFCHILILILILRFTGGPFWLPVPKTLALALISTILALFPAWGIHRLSGFKKKRV